TQKKNKTKIAKKNQSIELLKTNPTVKPPIPKNPPPTPPHQKPVPKVIHRTLDLARLTVKAVSLGRLISLLEKTSSVCQIWLSRASRTILKLKVSQHKALAITAVALLMIPIAYFSLPRAATETS